MRGPSKASAADRDDDHVGRVAQIFAQLFDLADVPPDADFFRLGGDSLLAEQFVVEVENRFGVVLSPSVLIEAPTPRALASVIGPAHARDGSPLFAARQGSGPPVFCVHGNGGHSLFPSRIAKALGGGFPIWGLRAIGLEDGERPLTEVAAMAGCYVDAIEAQARPGGPLVLIGHCCGAYAAHEMAHLLAQRGRPVAALVLIDPDTKPSYVPFLHQSGVRLALTRAKLAWRARRDGPPAAADAAMPGADRRRRVSRTFKMAVARHRPKRLHCPALLIHTPPRRAALRDPRRGFPALLADVRFVEIEVEHDRMFHDRIHEIADLVEAFIDGASGRVAAPARVAETLRATA